MIDSSILLLYSYVAGLPGEKGTCIYATMATVLFSELVLDPGESQTFEYSALVPDTAPPSFKGDCMTYSHKVGFSFSPLYLLVRIRLPLKSHAFKDPAPYLLERS